ncbi:MAG: NAD(P)/FAD-dependent oxidoreductase [Alphaproteobacteria bacterium]|nr:NAD(P)/FAD-dependent oxidoreductase [Alphaproteobacteria bacterium]
MGMKPSAAIVGAGLGGLCVGALAKQAGFDDIVLLEQADSVGGTWRDNSYPGCCCDVPVALYQFSFFQSIAWSHLFPRAEELHRYTNDFTDAMGLRPHLKLGDGVVRAVWDEEKGAWHVTTRKGNSYDASVLVMALGQLNRPQWPQIEGRDSFKGHAFHSARWDHGLSLEGKRVGVIGSAASAVQIIPEVAKIARELVVFQRTPNWVIPRLDRPITDEEKTLMMTDPEAAMKIGARARANIYENADHFFWQAFAWTPEGRAAVRRQALNHLEAQVQDPVLRAKLIPDYPPGCKRVLIADDFYPALTRSNVILETDGIKRIVPEGVEMNTGKVHAFDVIVYATGFETTGWHWSADVIGRDGRSLNDVWKDGPEAYLGLSVANFPNMFMTYGPNTNLGHNSITFMIERQAEYIIAAMKQLEERGLKAMEVKASAQKRFNKKLQADLGKTVWADPHCTSWYKNANGRITQNWSSHTRDYAKATRKVAMGDYLLTEKGAGRKPLAAE